MFHPKAWSKEEITSIIAQNPLTALQKDDVELRLVNDEWELYQLPPLHDVAAQKVLLLRSKNLDEVVAFLSTQSP